MGNNQGGLHKRERGLDGQQRARQWAAGSIPSASSHMMSGGSTTEDGCPVQVCIHFCGFSWDCHIDNAYIYQLVCLVDYIVKFLWSFYQGDYVEN